MTSEAKPRIKVTYATLRADNEDLHAGFEEAAMKVRGELGGYHQNYVDGAWRDGVCHPGAVQPCRPHVAVQRCANRCRDRAGGGGDAGSEPAGRRPKQSCSRLRPRPR